MTVSSLPQYAFWFNGYTFGGAGSVHAVQSVDGLTALPTIRNQDDDSGYSDGMFTGDDFMNSRTVTIHIITTSGGGHSAEYNFNQLRRALLPQVSGTQPLQFQLGASNGLQRVNARVRGHLTTLDPDFTYGYILSAFTFFCPDPYIYDDTLKTAVMVVGNPLGFTFPLVFPLTFGGGSSATTTPIVNDGDWTTYPVITLNGPIVNPTLGSTTEGKYITLNGSFNSTDVIVIDLENKLVTLNGSSARNLLTGLSQWFDAPAGTSQFYLSGAGTVAGVTQATVAYRSAYI